jgi:Predicted transmembrane and coiled-coil 2 protein
MEHLSQQQFTVEGIDNSNARALVVKLINVVLTILQVVLLLTATAAGILMPFLKTRWEYFNSSLFLSLSPWFISIFQGSCTHNGSLGVIYNICCKNVAWCAWHWISHGSTAQRDSHCEVINFKRRSMKRAHCCLQLDLIQWFCFR